MNNIFKTKVILITFILLCFNINSYAQTQFSICELNGSDLDDGGCLNVVSTAVPLLRATSDARSGAMGEVGLAISADANSLFWNASKLAFAESKSGLSISFTPWLSALVSDVFLSNITGYMVTDENQALAASFRYFSFGTIQFTDELGNILQDFNPNEFYFDLGYSRKLSDQLSLGLTLKYINSNLGRGTSNTGNIKPGQAVAADVSTYYNKFVALGDMDAKLAFGLNISNIGNKISYSNDGDVRDFIPTNFGIGSALEMEFDEYNSLTIGLDINKLMVPTPDTIDLDLNDIPDHRELGSIDGMFSSWSDAPEGDSEAREFMFSLGAEYWYNNLFALRAGYFHENENKGNRKYATFGIGLKYNVFGLNVSYLQPVAAQNHPLARTIRFSLLFDFDQAN